MSSTPQGPRLGEIVEHVEVHDFVPRLVDLASRLRAFVDGPMENSARTELRVALQTLIARQGFEISRLAQNPFDAEHVARAARNTFECDLILRFVLEAEANLVQWTSLRVQEEIEILKSLLLLTSAENVQDPRRIEVQTRIESLNNYLVQHGRSSPKRLPRVKELARRSGVSEEYEGLYGLYSKYIHPTSWMLNKPDRGWERHFIPVLTMHAQIYVIDALMRTAKALSIVAPQLSRPAAVPPDQIPQI